MQEAGDILIRMIRDDSDLEAVRDWAYKLHKNDKYGDHPYTYHLEGVAEKVIELAPILLEHASGDYYDNLEKALICAFLHDAVEDGHASFQDVLHVLDRHMVSESAMIVNAIQFLTRHDDETYPQYILNRICNKGCHITKLVKVADLRFNKEQNKLAMERGKKHFEHMYDKYSFAEFIVMQSIYTKI